MTPYSSTPLLLSTLILALSACTISPQRPSQRSGQTAEPDSATLAMVELHQQLADAADRELSAYRREHPGRWFEQGDGSWCQPDTIPLNYAYSPSRPIAMRIITRDIKGKMLSDVQGYFEIGKCQLPPAVENFITTNFPQSTVNFIMLAPYYVAYGSQGTDAVPPLTNVIMEIDIQ